MRRSFLNNILFLLIMFHISFLCSHCASGRAAGIMLKSPCSAHPKMAMASDNHLAKMLAGELSKRGCNIVEKANLDGVLSEQAGGRVGEATVEKLLQAAKSLGASYVIRVKSLPCRQGQEVDHRCIEEACVRIEDVNTGELVMLVIYRNTSDWSMKDSLEQVAKNICDKMMSFAKKKFPANPAEPRHPALQ